MKIFVSWTLTYLFAQLLLTAIQFFIRKKEIKPYLRFILIIFKAVLAIIFAVLVLAGPVQLRPFQPFLIALYAALLMDAVADFVYTVFCLIKKTERKFYTEKIISLILGILFFVYGTVNMQIVKPNYNTFYSEKLNEEHKIIFVSDIHVGSAQEFKTLEKEVNDMKAENPDCIILGGDITDDYTTRSEMENAYGLFGSVDIPVYYLHGNHDRQKHAEYANGIQYTAEELEDTIKKNGIVILKDDYVSIGNDLILLGREDISEKDNRKDFETIYNENPDRSKYLIVADHQPFDFKENYKFGNDFLQLSGHTHAGQLFPLKFLYSIIGYAYGKFEYKEAELLVSSGACGWRVPFRTDSHCYFEVITLKPSK